MITDAAGAVVGRYAYDPYGQATHTGNASTPLQFNGQYTDAESGLIYLHSRYYDPVTAQFVTADPLTALTRTRYSYAWDNPLAFTDPSGLCGGWCWAGIAGTAFAVVGLTVATGGGDVLLAPFVEAEIMDLTASESLLNATASVSDLISTGISTESTINDCMSHSTLNCEFDVPAVFFGGSGFVADRMAAKGLTVAAMSMASLLYGTSSFDTWLTSLGSSSGTEALCPNQSPR